MLCKQVAAIVKSHVGSGENFVGHIDKNTRFWASKADAETIAFSLRSLGVRFSLRSAGCGWERGVGVSMWDVANVAKIKPTKTTARKRVKPVKKAAKLVAKAATVAAPVVRDNRPAYMRSNNATAAAIAGRKLKAV